MVEQRTRTFDDGTVRAFDDAIALVPIGIGRVVPDAFGAAGGVDLGCSVGIPVVNGFRTFEILDGFTDMLCGFEGSRVGCYPSSATVFDYVRSGVEVSWKFVRSREYEDVVGGYLSSKLRRRCLG